MSLLLNQFSYQVQGIRLLDIPHQEFKRGALSVIKGPSGAGKSTLLYGLAGIDMTCGTLQLDGQRIPLTTAKQRDKHRQKNIGLIFQNIHLFSGLSCLQNVLLPFSFKQTRVTAEQRNRATELLMAVGINQFNQRVNHLSRGEKQRVAIARALLSDSEILLADEPTASLDETSSQTITELLKQISQQNKIVVVTSHDPILQQQADTLLTLQQGTIV